MSGWSEETKKYLGQLCGLDRIIENRIKERTRLRSTITSISNTIGDEKVQTSGVKDRVGDSVAKMVDLENEIDALIDKFVDKKRTITSQLESMSDPDYYQVLYLRYVDRKSFKDISTEMDRGVRTVVRIHGNAMTEFERRYSHLYISQ